ncbi:hypothetical protein J6590_049202 [Homalodisca vitripennis]|nr:hypothetical protein J6590_049202 [Homalodisca vitripennis]
MKEDFFSASINICMNLRHVEEKSLNDQIISIRSFGELLVRAHERLHNRVRFDLVQWAHAIVVRHARIPAYNFLKTDRQSPFQ